MRVLKKGTKMIVHRLGKNGYPHNIKLGEILYIAKENRGIFYGGYNDKDRTTYIVSRNENLDTGYFRIHHSFIMEFSKHRSKKLNKALKTN